MPLQTGSKFQELQLIVQKCRYRATNLQAYRKKTQAQRTFHEFGMRKCNQQQM